MINYYLQSVVLTGFVFFSQFFWASRFLFRLNLMGSWCCLIPVLTLIVLRLMLDDIDDISFTKRRNFLIVSWMSISVYCIPTRDTHITRDMCMGIHISRGYTYHCDTGSSSHVTVLDSEKACRLVFLESECTIYTAVCMFLCFTNLSSPLGFVSSLCTVLLYP